MDRSGNLKTTSSEYPVAETDESMFMTITESLGGRGAVGSMVLVSIMSDLKYKFLGHFSDLVLAESEASFARTGRSQVREALHKPVMPPPTLHTMYSTKHEESTPVCDTP